MNQETLSRYQGKHLAELRKNAGLSQYQLARLLGISQSNIAFWERTDKPPRAEILPDLAKILGVSVEDLLNLEETEKTSNRRGPKGKIAKLFEQVVELPKSQQDKIADVVSLFLEQYKLINQNQLDLQNKEESSAA